MNKKVIAAGHICVDITPVFHSRKVKRLDELLLPGKLLHVGDADVHTGGSVANTGLAMKILGADISLMGMVGADSFGEIVKNILNKYDADEGLLVKDDKSTSYTIVVAVPGVDRVFLHNPGANDEFCAEDIPEDKLSETALFHFGYPPIMKRMYQNQGEELIKVMKKAKAAGAATSLDLAAVDPESEAGQADWKEIIRSVLPYVDFFVPSVEELCYMIDHERFEEWQNRAEGRDITEILDVEKDIRPLADRCMEYGAKVLLIKCGAPGMYYRTAGKQILETISPRIDLNVEAWADKEGFENSYIPDKILSGTGAGDTSIAAFLTAMLEGYDPEWCMHFAAAEGACCVEAYDSLGGLKTLDDLRRKIESGWKKNG